MELVSHPYEYYWALPTDDPPKLWIGKGNGRRCDACDFPITDLENEFDSAEGRGLRFHRACFNIWDVERKQEA